MSELTDKDIYRLWWEYLKRSDDYKLFCTWHRDRKDNPDLPLPKKLQHKGERLDDLPFTFIFTVFLDVHAKQYRAKPYGFETWWKRKQDIIRAIQDQHSGQNGYMTRDYGTAVLSDIQMCMEKLRKFEGQAPTFKDFKGYFGKRINTALPPKLYLEIDLAAPEVGPVIREINEHIIRAKKGVRARQWELLSDRTNWPVSKFVYMDLKRYLIVYDLKRKGMKMAEIIHKVGTPTQRDNYSDENVLMSYREDFAKAKRIIRNVEEGRFPGYYGKYSR